jgi:Uup-like ABC transporter family protein
LRHLIRQAEKELATLERRRGRLADDLADAGADRDALASIGTELAAVEAELADVEQRWLALAVEAETD